MKAALTSFHAHNQHEARYLWAITGIHMKNQTESVFITKYALTEGIRQVDVESCEQNTGMRVCKSNGPCSREYFHNEGKDWHKTFEGAKQRAEQMKENKIKSLKKSMARINSLSFDSLGK